MCSREQGHRFTTTAQGLNDTYLAEPPTTGSTPHLTSASAYRNFERLYGHLTDAERHSTQVRYGRITDAAMGPASNNAIEFVPMTRRASAWMISSCTIYTPPPLEHREPGSPGTLLFIVADTAKPRSLGWDYDYTDKHGTRTGFSGGGDARGIPRPAATHYYSVPWHQVTVVPNRHKLLLRYRQIRCYALDHINVDEDVYADHGTRITVILSTGPNDSCATPSAIAPYMEAVAVPDPFGRIHHGRTGALSFEPFGSR
jgi:hypothetical protein